MASNPTSQLGVKERFYKYFKAENTTLLQQLSDLEALSPVSGEQKDGIEHCRGRIAHLRKEIQEVSPHVPAYDRKIYTDAIKGLEKELGKIIPKPKYSFNMRKNDSALDLLDAAELARQNKSGLPGYVPSLDSGSSTSAATTPAYLATPPGEEQNPESRLHGNAGAQKQPESTSAPQKMPSSTSSQTVAFSDLSNQRLTLPALSNPNLPATMNHLSRCVLLPPLAPTTSPSSLLLPLASLTLTSTTSSLLVFPTRISRSSHITALTDSVLVLATQQLRMHDCKDCTVYVHCLSKPVIEGCEGMRFARLPERVRRLLGMDGMEKEGNLEVEDFGWRRMEQSPNWRLLGEEEGIDDGGWEELFCGSKEEGVDSVLKKVGIEV